MKTKRMILVVLAMLITACSTPMPTQSPTQAAAPTFAPEPTKVPPTIVAPTAVSPIATLAPQPTTAPTAIPAALKISSPAFKLEAVIPTQFTCSGTNISPELVFSGLPAGTLSLALIADDPDAPGGTWVHWVVYNMPPTLTGLPEGVKKAPVVEGIGTQGTTSFAKTGYGGPCPPVGDPHRYFFKLYALDLKPELESGLNANDLAQIIKGHVLGEAFWMGTFQRK